MTDILSLISLFVIIKSTYRGLARHLLFSIGAQGANLLTYE